ncbi:MAG TPA: SRPBCC family protein [Povalibacter sp.]|nr:SRPBCC family protein [Povalibacter sp.]
MNNKTETAAGTADREILITRLVDAPRELVWQVWTSPEHVGQWWGPNGFTTTIHEMQVVPGGVWRFIMHGPDGVDYPNRIEFIEVTRPQRLVYQHGDDKGEIGFHVTVTFTEQAGKTLVTLRSLFPTAAARDFAVSKYGAIEGGRQTLGRLDAYVANLQ